MSDVTVRQAWSEALRYWEPRRIVYNVALLLVVAGVFLAHLPAARERLTFETVEILFVLAVLANISYCAAHAVDVMVQLSTVRPVWLRARWTLFATGVVLAAILSHLCRQIFA
jgi:hypothetical protein